MRRRGTTLVEVMVVGVLLSILMAGLLSIFTAINGAFTFTSEMPDVQDKAQRMTQDMAAAIRKATLAKASDSGCTANAAMEAASSTSITLYSGANGSITKTSYANSGGNVEKTVGLSTASVWYSGASLAFTYYQSSTYRGTAITPFTPNSSTVTQVIAVGVTGTYTSGGRTATYSTIVRLRNGPLKTTSSE